MEHIKSHFEERIVEDQPLSTSSFGKAFDQFRGRFGEPVVEDKPLSTTPFGTTFDHIDGHFQEPIVEDQPLSTSSFRMAFEISPHQGSLWGANCREPAIKYQFFKIDF